MSFRSVRIGTRKSDLAVTQARQVQSELEKLGVSGELVYIESTGDKDTKNPLYAVDPTTPGLFTKQLEQALLEDKIDLAVHSLKDLPTQQPKELQVGCILRRVNPQDCLVVSKSCLDPNAPFGVKPTTKIGTSSLRREALLKSVDEEIQVSAIRGNVPTRVQKVRDQEVDAVVLACAGIDRLGLTLQNLEKLPLPVDSFVPAPGQGAIAVEIRSQGSESLQESLQSFHCEKTSLETQIERSILRELEGGCSLPLGVYCTQTSSGGFNLKAFLGLGKQTSEQSHSWQAFRHFDLSEKSADTVIQKTVEFFRGFQNEFA